MEYEQVMPFTPLVKVGSSIWLKEQGQQLGRSTHPTPSVTLRRLSMSRLPTKTNFINQLFPLQEITVTFGTQPS